MTPLIATFWRRRLITNTESTSTSHAVKRSGPNAPSGGDCDSTSGSGTFSTCHTSLNAQLPSESSSERKGFPSAKSYGTRPMKRAVSGSSSDRADATISDHSSISDIKVDNTTRPPTMTSNDSSAGSPTPADKQRSDSESTQVISSAERQQPTSAATPTSILRNSDTISTSIATEDQRHTDSTSVTSRGQNSSGNPHGTSSVGLSTTQLTSAPSTSPTTIGSKNSSSDLDTSGFVLKHGPGENPPIALFHPRRLSQLRPLRGFQRRALIDPVLVRRM
ncbi:hypothetical protein DFJ43DRAFT_632833 [Lentinula guzmanii]|uniref:Uncharacterized protein n=1 Tax=Lentinula guzmanii TaxID=2804957 RepID=A0AA38N3Z2_9AGAR|nr:hypothetical protein DFJ43DRAFT_632833 [Lentinula guzmanii]